MHNHSRPGNTITLDNLSSRFPIAAVDNTITLNLSWWDRCDLNTYSIIFLMHLKVFHYDVNINSTIKRANSFIYLSIEKSFPPVFSVIRPRHGKHRGNARPRAQGSFSTETSSIPTNLLSEFASLPTCLRAKGDNHHEQTITAQHSQSQHSTAQRWAARRKQHIRYLNWTEII